MAFGVISDLTYVLGRGREMAREDGQTSRSNAPGGRTRRGPANQDEGPELAGRAQAGRNFGWAWVRVDI